MSQAHKRWLAAALAVGCLVLWLTAIPETFTVDECNYFATVHALRDGGLFVPGTAELTPSVELVGFDPVGHRRALEAGRIASNAPPLYAPFALPLSYLGWRWLILLNVIGFGFTAWLTYDLARRIEEKAGYVALGLFALGGFSIDYAQAVWPHMVSVAFMTGALWLSVRARRDDRIALAVAAGLCVGIGAGIRYQNIVFGAALGLTLLIWGKRRVWLGGGLAAGTAVPLAITSLINHARLGSYHPLSKGEAYLPTAAPVGPARSPLEPLWALYARVVDFSAHPPFQAKASSVSLPKHPDTGAFLVIGGLKKALLQSAPWIAVALVAMAMVWTRRARITDDKRELIRALSLPAAFVLALFSWAGLERNDGWSFNQRYLLELVPLFAVSTALVVATWARAVEKIVLGGVIGAAMAAVPVVAAAPEHTFRQRALMIVPLVIAAAILGVWAAGKRTYALRAPCVAAALGWALVVHVGDDIVATRGMRDWNGFQRAIAAQHLPDAPAALVAMSPQKEAMCPLHLEHDLVLVDPAADGGEALHQLVGELLAANRRVFVMGGLPDPWLEAIFRGRRVKMHAVKPMPVGEVLEGPARSSP